MSVTASLEQSALPLPDQSQPDDAPASRRRRSQPYTRKLGTKPLDGRMGAALGDPSRVLFLDVETTGLSRYYDSVTIVGWLLDGEYRVHVSGDDPTPLLTALANAAALVTFNGTLFDVPFLRKTFPQVALPTVHADLRYLARRVGLTGGQKRIEEELGLKLRSGHEELNGFHATLLWHRYLRGDTPSLRRLIEYNRSDVTAMCHILDVVLQRLPSIPDLWSTRPTFGRVQYRRTGFAARNVQLPSADRLNRPKNTFRSLFSGTAAERAVVIGIDLTGSEQRPSGWCTLRGNTAWTDMVATDEEIVARICSEAPDLVSIDSPLSIPFGRSRVEDDDPARNEFGIMRQCERELKRRGINVYPCLLPSMQKLTKRGMQLAERIRAAGIPVIESYPGAAQDIMGIPRKGAGEALLKQGLAEFGVRGSFEKSAVRHDELDAITSALVGSFFLAGKYEPLTGPEEDALIIPKLDAQPGPIVVGVSGRICAGKTTAARALEERGFAYTRFSQVIDEEIRRRGKEPTRALRQEIGYEINQTKGQRWLCERALERVGGRPLIVIDGLRFLADRAFMIERFGSRFMHLHIKAPVEVRRARSGQELELSRSFDEADHQPVEGEIDVLGRFATVALNNVTGVEEFRQAALAAVESYARKVGSTCPYPS